MEIFDVFSMNGIENNPASGEIFLENVILKVSQTHFPRISIPRGRINFSRGGNAPLGGGREVPCKCNFQGPSRSPERHLCSVNILSLTVLLILFSSVYSPLLV